MDLFDNTVANYGIHDSIQILFIINQVQITKLFEILLQFHKNELKL